MRTQILLIVFDDLRQLQNQRLRRDKMSDGWLSTASQQNESCLFVYAVRNEKKVRETVESNSDDEEPQN